MAGGAFKVLFEAGLKERVVADIPTFPVPCDHIAARIEERDVFA